MLHKNVYKRDFTQSDLKVLTTAVQAVICDTLFCIDLPITSHRRIDTCICVLNADWPKHSRDRRLWNSGGINKGFIKYSLKKRYRYITDTSFLLPRNMNVELSCKISLIYIFYPSIITAVVWFDHLVLYSASVSCEKTFRQIMKWSPVRVCMCVCVCEGGI